MRSTAVSALLALVAVQQAAAGMSGSGDWNQAQSLPSCQNADNQCNNQQKQGLDFTNANLPQGSCSGYGGFDLTGFSYGSFGGKSKRDLFPRGGSQGSSGNCIQGAASKGSGPQVSCGSSVPNQKASITNLQVSVDTDVDVEFVHTYEGSSQTCSYTKSCKAGSVNSIQNTQCGGSSAVKCQLPSTSEHQGSCNIGVHSIGFDCTPGQQSSSSSPPQSSPSQAPSSPAESKPTVPASKPVIPSGTAPYPKPSGSKSVSPPGSAPYPSPSGSVPATPASSPSTPAASVPATPASSPTTPATSAPATSPSAPASSPVPSVPASSAPSEIASSTSPSPPESTVEQVTSEVVYTTITSCPVTSTKTYGTTTSVEVVTQLSTVLITSTKTICTKCIAPKKTSSVPSPPESQVPTSSVPAPPASSPPAPPASSAPAPPASSPPAPPASSAPSQVASSVVPSPPGSTPPVVPGSTPPVVPGSTPPVVPASSPAPSQVASSTVPAPPAVPQTTQEVVTTAIVYTTLTTCPVTNTVTPPHGTPIQQVTTTISTITSTSISTVCTKCIAPVASTPAAPPASSTPVQVATSVAPPASSAPAVVASSAPPAASPSAPGVLPSCVKTWVTVTKCKDNSDYDCYCQDDTFTQSVYECISSWESDQSQQQAAFSYYAGICAPHVPAHPAIVTAVPSTITLVPQPATTSSPVQQATSVAAPPVTSAPSVPAVAGVTSPAVAPAAAPATTPAPAAAPLPPTTISISTTVTLPCSAVGLANQITDGQLQASGTMAPGCTTTKLLQTAVTVPQVAFTTGASSSVGLAAGPAPVQAAATGAPAPAGVPGVAAGSSSASVVKPTGTTPFTGAAAKAGPSSVVAVIFGAVAMALFV